MNDVLNQILALRQVMLVDTLLHIAEHPIKGVRRGLVEHLRKELTDNGPQRSVMDKADFDKLIKIVEL
jgi:hypothetical protein